jgi:phage antirepressor YoqD-like protein
MEELEKQAAPKIEHNVPQTYAQALMEAAQTALLLEEKQKQLVLKDQVIAVKETELALAAPKVEFHKRFVSHGDNFTATDIAKKLHISAVRLNDWLEDNDVLFVNRKHFKQWYINKGYGVEKFTEVGQDIYSKFYHTAKGADWILSNYGAK